MSEGLVSGSGFQFTLLMHLAPSEPFPLQDPQENPAAAGEHSLERMARLVESDSLLHETSAGWAVHFFPPRSIHPEESGGVVAPLVDLSPVSDNW